MEYFLLKILAELGQIKPLIHHGDLISIGFKFNNITFKDYQQLLIFSLRKLGKAFGVEILKSYFPYNFVNEQGEARIRSALHSYKVEYKAI
jgi:DNA polymerase type B, organellar and viral